MKSGKEAFCLFLPHIASFREPLHDDLRLELLDIDRLHERELSQDPGALHSVSYWAEQKLMRRRQPGELEGERGRGVRVFEEDLNSGRTDECKYSSCEVIKLIPLQSVSFLTCNTLSIRDLGVARLSPIIASESLT